MTLHRDLRSRIVSGYDSSALLLVVAKVLLPNPLLNFV